MNLFLVSYDYLNPKFSAAALHQYIFNSNLIDGWWHWLPGIYIVRTSLDQPSLDGPLRSVMNGANFIVIALQTPNSLFGPAAARRLELAKLRGGGNDA